MFPGHMPLEPRVEKFWVGDRSTRVGLGRAPHDCAVGLIIGILVLAYFCWSIARLSLQLGGEQQGLPPVADSAVMNVHRPEPRNAHHPAEPADVANGVPRSVWCSAFPVPDETRACAFANGGAGRVERQPAHR